MNDKHLVSIPLQNGRKTARTLRMEIQNEWEDLWAHKFEDKIASEYVARRDYGLLFIDEGTVIKATRDYRPLDLRDIVQRNELVSGVRLANPEPEVGGYRHFAKKVLSHQIRWGKNNVGQELAAEKPVHHRPKNGGKGWRNQF